MDFNKLDEKLLNGINNRLRDIGTEGIIRWALSISKRPVLTTNFGPYSASLIHAVAIQKKDIKLIWIDTGYNTPQTNQYARNLIDRFNLNMKIYKPKQNSVYKDEIIDFPSLDDPKHKLFTHHVKLEPFQRALQDHRPDVWFTNIRNGQTTHRDSLDIVSFSKEGIMKVSPFYHWSDTQIEEYLNAHNLPNELNYFDPTKQLMNRECGLHY